MQILDVTRQNKLTSTFSTTPYTVIRRSKSQITVRSESGHIVTRNISHFKSITRQNDSEVGSDTEMCGKEPLENRDQSCGSRLGCYRIIYNVSISYFSVIINRVFTYSLKL